MDLTIPIATRGAGEDVAINVRHARSPGAEDWDGMGGSDGRIKLRFGFEGDHTGVSKT